MSEVLVVGSLAYDTISSPAGSVQRTLGGSANYFSLAAHHFARIRVVGVVGEDYQEEDLEELKSRQIDTLGLQVSKGQTFHWSGRYSENLNEAETLATELNVFSHFKAQVPESYARTPFLFLANIDPVLQKNVLSQVHSPRLTALDTMNFWISSQKEDLSQVLRQVDLILINEGESTLLTGERNPVRACACVLKMGPKAVVIKRGEYGFVLQMGEDLAFLPAFPTAQVVDPTGAGDSFAGGLFAYLASRDQDLEFHALKSACVRGAVMASFTVEGFGMKSLKEVDMKKFQARFKQYLNMLKVELC